MIEPRDAQIEALYALNKTRQEGYSKALIQAAKAFKKIHQTENIGLLDQDHKDLDAKILMASVLTLSSDQYLNHEIFSRKAFDYIVIDEFHHAAAKSYQKILDYLQPKFLLGLSATPERMDGRSVYALCDFNVPYKVDLQKAINRSLLVPFHYYAIYDDTDYSQMRKSGGRFVIEDLEKAYESSKSRSLSILKHYRKYPSKQAIGFCASKAHASLMARYFTDNGIPSAAVYSSSSKDPYALERAEAISQLQEGKKRVLFTVDMFNEGVDIETIDMVMFLRPTESSTIFLQQLGRGLRLSKGKKYLTLLDFIGNYEKAFLSAALLSKGVKKANSLVSIHQLSLPEGCLYDFDLELIDLFEKIKKSKRTKSEWIKDEYYRIRQTIEHRPSQREFFENMEDELLDIILRESSLNPFQNYLAFLNGLGELNEEEKILMNSMAGKFIYCIETTAMSRVYKMPVLMSLIDQEHQVIRMEVSDKKMLEQWKSFFSKNENWKDLSKKGQNLSFQEYKQITDRAHLQKIRSQPVHFLTHSEAEFFSYEDHHLILNPSLRDFQSNLIFFEWIKNVVEFRSELYYFSRFQKKLLD